MEKNYALLPLFPCSVDRVHARHGPGPGLTIHGRARARHKTSTGKKGGRLNYYLGRGEIPPPATLFCEDAVRYELNATGVGPGAQKHY